MAADYLHGVEQYFLENLERPIEVLAASTIGLVATGDDADPATFPLNVPVLCNSDKLIAKAGRSGTLRNALMDIYRQAGAVVVVVRVASDEEEAPQLANVVGTIDNESGSYSGLKALLAAESLVGVRPRLIIAPEFSHLVGVGEAMEAVAKKLNAIPIIDGSQAGYSAVIAEAAKYKEALFVNCGVKLLDDDTGAVVTRKASATIAGHIVRVDNEEGYWNSPSSRKIYGILGTDEVIDHAIGSTTSKANLYNSKNVTVIVNQQGGWFLYGNRLANSVMLPHQRIRYIVGDSILYAHQELLDRNVTKGYVDGVKNRVNKLLRRLIAREVISGGECWVDKELNESAIGTGQVYWDYDLGFFDVAERMTFRQHVTTRYNEAIFE
ncbi:phage tail sheath C-terminal domain-containing protein [Pseudomonas aeruginosa]|uniref:phage tail sheath C-terminal domain-containing protein n=2 Tax=Pseudomonas aeruginosa TaxID=287 RepID=UPI001A3345A4|nr:phage tail sheath C-terminal domain-containing protein [Pseudomonas aeruginosa]MBH9149111.1 phage tail sheath subtilisin-like domain-containing protein [Pseudomonas aeruginosa]WAJ88569.1 phage tail sheath subtilisin-like domain-containing protein [Pseudomonas aeruginosa]